MTHITINPSIVDKFHLVSYHHQRQYVRTAFFRSCSRNQTGIWTRWITDTLLGRKFSVVSSQVSVQRTDANLGHPALSFRAKTRFFRWSVRMAKALFLS